MCGRMVEKRPTVLFKIPEFLVNEEHNYNFTKLKISKTILFNQTQGSQLHYVTQVVCWASNQTPFFVFVFTSSPAVLSVIFVGCLQAIIRPCD